MAELIDCDLMEEVETNLYSIECAIKFQINFVSGELLATTELATILVEWELETCNLLSFFDYM